MKEFTASDKLLCGLRAEVLRGDSFTAANSALAKYGRTEVFSTFFRYQSLVIGLTEY